MNSCRMIVLVFAIVSSMTLKTSSATQDSCTIRIDTGPTVRNCRDVQVVQGHYTNGIYTVYPYDRYPQRPLKVFCDMETDGGGWTVIQRREDIEPREDFFRTWMEYALGFGNLKAEFWLGNDNIHSLTDQALNEIRFDLADFEGNTRWAQYGFFYVHDRSLSYKMEVNSYSGDAGDSFADHNTHDFSAKDKDLDTYASESCSMMFHGGWWYSNCHGANLNGLYLKGKDTYHGEGVNWHTWLTNTYSLKTTEMKIRPSY